MNRGFTSESVGSSQEKRASKAFVELKARRISNAPRNPEMTKKDMMLKRGLTRVLQTVNSEEDDGEDTVDALSSIFDIFPTDPSLQDLGLIRFNSPLARVIDVILCFIAAMSVAMGPVHFAFEDFMSESTFNFYCVADMICESLYLLCLLVKLRTSTADFRRGREIMSTMGSIKGRLTQPRYLVDMISMYPFLILGHPPPASPYWLFKLIRAHRLLKVPESFFALKFSSELRLLRMLIAVVMVVHTNACIWFSVVTSTGSLEERVSAEDRQTIFAQYAWSFRHAVYMVLGQHIHSTNALEWWYLGLCALIGSLYCATVYAFAAVLMGHMNATTSRHMERMGLVRSAMESLDLPNFMRYRIMQYYQFLALHHHSHAYQELMGGLSTNLLIQVKAHLFRRLFTDTPLFQQSPGRFINRLVVVLQEAMFSPGDVIIRQGDMGMEMYFIVRGRVDVLDTGMHKVAQLSENQYFGEVALLADTERVCTIRAASYCLLATISRDKFMPILDDFPIQKKFIIQQIGTYKTQQPHDENEDDDESDDSDSNTWNAMFRRIGDKLTGQTNRAEKKKMQMQKTKSMKKKEGSLCVSTEYETESTEPEALYRPPQRSSVNGAKQVRGSILKVRPPQDDQEVSRNENGSSSCTVGSQLDPEREVSQEEDECGNSSSTEPISFHVPKVAVKDVSKCSHKSSKERHSFTDMNLIAQSPGEAEVPQSSVERHKSPNPSGQSDPFTEADSLFTQSPTLLGQHGPPGGTCGESPEADGAQDKEIGQDKENGSDLVITSEVASDQQHAESPEDEVDLDQEVEVQVLRLQQQLDARHEGLTKSLFSPALPSSSSSRRGSRCHIAGEGPGHRISIAGSLRGSVSAVSGIPGVSPDSHSQRRASALTYSRASDAPSSSASTSLPLRGKVSSDSSRRHSAQPESSRRSSDLPMHHVVTTGGTASTAPGEGFFQYREVRQLPRVNPELRACVLYLQEWLGENIATSLESMRVEMQIGLEEQARELRSLKEALQTAHHGASSRNRTPSPDSLQVPSPRAHSGNRPLAGSVESRISELV